MAIDGARIQRVTKEGLFYLDDEGREKFISFALCHLNYVMEFVDRSQHLSRERRQEEIKWRRTLKCVGDKSSIGSPFSELPCMQFYTNPPILFEFVTEDEFQVFQRSLREYGWSAYDRS